MPGACFIETCERPMDSHGLCSGHAHRLRRYGDARLGGPLRERSAGTCSVAGCSKNAAARRLCKMHWVRLRLYGDVNRDREAGMAPKRAERFERLIDKSGANGCWIWLGLRCVPERGEYGVFCGRPAHRVAYERVHGPIPGTRVLDHLCRVHLCVNPAHLEPVTIERIACAGTSTRLRTPIGRPEKASGAAARASEPAREMRGPHEGVGAGPDTEGEARAEGEVSEATKAFFYQDGKWTEKSVAKMTADELRLALTGYLKDEAERKDGARAAVEERVRLRVQIEELEAIKLRMETRLDALLYSLVLMQAQIRGREKQLREAKAMGGDALALAV